MHPSFLVIASNFLRHAIAEYYEWVYQGVKFRLRAGVHACM